MNIAEEYQKLNINQKYVIHSHDNWAYLHNDEKKLDFTGVVDDINLIKIKEISRTDIRENDDWSVVFTPISVLKHENYLKASDIIGETMSKHNVGSYSELTEDIIFEMMSKYHSLGFKVHKI